MNLITLAIAGLLAIFGVNRLNQIRMKNFQIDFSNVPGKVYVVTGANSGLGYETSKDLLKHGARVIMACRDLIRGEAARANMLVEIASTYPATDKNKILDELEERVTVIPLDLASFDSIRKFPDLLDGESVTSIDALINNAGIMALPERLVTDEGHEMQLGTNHFGHFLFTMVLFPRIVDGGRIVNHASGAHMFHDKDFPYKNMQSEDYYDPWVAYGNSKVANLMFTYTLRRRIQHLPKQVHVLAVHPGYSATHLQANRFPMWETVNALFAMSAADGALSQTYAAVDPRAVPVALNDTRYIGPEWMSFGPPAPQSPFSRLCWDEKAQEHLWRQSVAITGVDLPNVNAC